MTQTRPVDMNSFAICIVFVASENLGHVISVRQLKVAEFPKLVLIHGTLLSLLI